MLRSLAISDFVIVDRLELEFEPGFTVLTGETGAGKSILIDALALVLGERAEALVVRAGAERAEVSAEFDITGTSELARWLKENELAGDDGGLLVRRVVESSGRSRGFINGHAATLAQLREAGEFLVDIHGQHEHQSLLRAAAQRELLDAHGGCQPLERETGDAFRAWKRLEALAAEAEKSFSAREAEREQLQEAVADLKKVAPAAGEWEKVSAEQTRLEHGSSLVAGAQSSLEALAEADGAVLAQLEAVAGRLRALSEHDARLKSIAELLDSAAAQAGEAVRDLRHYAERVDLDPAALREVEARIEALHAAARRYRVRPEALPGKFAELQARLSELALSGDPEALKREVAAARGRYQAVAKKLSAKRADAAQKLAKAVSAALQDLAMGGGRFSVSLRALEEPAAMGAEEIEFEVASHPSLPLRPLAKVASGGELSRVSLAIQLVLAGKSPVGTLVFDEVDTGIGGAVAETIGRSL